MKPSHALSTAAILIAMASPAYSTLLVYEGFNYSLSNGTSMGGVATTATGLTGNYTVNNGSGLMSSTYQTTGLSLTGFASSGGALLQIKSTASSGGSNFTVLGAQLNAGTQTGTLWSSYLFNITSASSDAQALAVSRLSTDVTGGTRQFASFSDTNTANEILPSVGYDASGTAGSLSLSANTTYLYVARFTNVGTALSAGTPGVATGWIFDQTAYNNWTLNGSTEAGLGTYAVTSVSDTVTTGTFGFTNSLYQQFGLLNSNTPIQGAFYDEQRWGTTLASITPIPEPSSALLVALAGGAAVFLRRRKKA